MCVTVSTDNTNMMQRGAAHYFSDAVHAFGDPPIAHGTLPMILATLTMITGTLIMMLVDTVQPPTSSTTSNIICQLKQKATKLIQRVKFPTSSAQLISRPTNQQTNTSACPPTDKLPTRLVT